jgi:hypothetical protein
MSPNAYVSWSDKSRVLCGYDGQSKEPEVVWDYSTIEDITGSAVTPSMYEYFSNYIANNISKDQLWEIETGDYLFGELEEEAVNAYYAESEETRTLNHEKMMLKLKSEHELAESKEHAAMNWLLKEDSFDSENPIYKEVCEYVRKLVSENKKTREKLERLIQEEVCWVHN